MSVGQLQTNKAWTELLKEVKHEADLWDAEDIELPYKGDSERSGAVTVIVTRKGVQTPLTCTKFSGEYRGPERNLCAIREVLRSLRLADQRGIGELMAKASQDMLSLPEGIHHDDPHYLLKIRPEWPEDLKIGMYRLMVIHSHPDNPKGSREQLDAVLAAGEKLGLR